MEIGRIFYTVGHVDADKFSQEVEGLTGEVVPVELVRHWYGRVVPLHGEDKGWSARAHVFTAKRGQGAKPFTVVDVGTASTRTQNKRVLSGVNIKIGDKKLLEDVLKKKTSEIVEIISVWARLWAEEFVQDVENGKYNSGD